MSYNKGNSKKFLAKIDIKKDSFDIDKELEIVRKLKNASNNSSVEPDMKKNLNTIKFSHGNLNTNQFETSASIFNKKPVSSDNNFKNKISFDPQISINEPKKIIPEPLKVVSKPVIGVKFNKEEEEKVITSYSNINDNMRDKSSFNPIMTKSFNKASDLMNSSISNFNSSSSKIENDGFRSTMTKMITKNLKEDNDEKDQQNDTKNNKKEDKKENSFVEEEYNDFAADTNSYKDEEEEAKEEPITINYERINAQLKRAKDLKQIIKLEEEYFENMFNVDVVATTHSKLEKLAQGLCKNALTQTFEGAEFGTQTEKIIHEEKYVQYGEEIDEQNTEQTIIQNTQVIDNLNSKQTKLNYQPLAYESYKFFVKFSSTIEKILLSNNTKRLMIDNEQSVENQNFAKTLEFKFPEVLFKYLNISSTNEYSLNFNDFLFFDVNPSIFIISHSLCFKGYINSIFSNDTVNLLLVVNINSGNVEKIFYTFSKITSLCAINEYEDIIIGGREDGVIDIFDMKPINEKFYLNYENLNKNIIFYEDDNEIKPEFYLKLPQFSTQNSHSSKIIKLKKIKLENNSFKIISLDFNGNILIWEFLDKDIKELHKIDYSPMRMIKEISLDRLLSQENIGKKVKCFNLEIKHSVNSRDSLYVLTNIGLLKIDIDLSEQHIYSFIHNNDRESALITAFSISDNGYLLCTYNDSCIKIIEEATNNTVCRIFIEGQDKFAYDKLYWSNVICKEKNRLFRRDLLSNFFLVSTKNDFYLFDMKKAPKKPKKKIELGTKKGLNSKNSNLVIVESLFHDFSNLILLSNNKTNSLEIYKLKLRNKFYEADKVTSFNNKLIDELCKSI